MPTPRTAQPNEAVNELRTALTEAGLTLPSLGIDPVTLAAQDEEPPLIALGRCTAETARALASALRGA